MYTKKTETAVQPNGNAMSKFKGLALQETELKAIKGGDDPVNPDTGIIIHEDIIDG